jgi:LAO/AO transport system kinase
MNLGRQVREGNRLALARLLTMLENDDLDARHLLDGLYPETGNAYIIGVTGPSGSGKSTLVNRLALALAFPTDTQHRLVAVLAVDPSSPFSGGALLGDRVRMRDLIEHPEIFIRSMATRGALGGLARTAAELVLAMEAAGFDIILVETVGAGQSEVDIARLAHTTLVVEAPGLGDDIQAAKAGILEIADILVLNKGDKSGADAAVHSLAAMLEIGAELAGLSKQTDRKNWQMPLIKTSALNNEGIDVLAEAIWRHHDHLHESGAWETRDKNRLRDLFDRLLRERLMADWRQENQKENIDAVLGAVYSRKLSPYQALEELFPSKNT